MAPPVWKKRTPAYVPELLEIWKEKYRMYTEDEGMGHSAAMTRIGQEEEGGVSRIIVGKWLFDYYKKTQQNSSNRRWALRKKYPELREYSNAHSAKYMAARRHIDEHIRSSFQRNTLAYAMTLENLTYCVSRETGVLFRPDVLYDLVKRYESKAQHPLLQEVPGLKLTYYRLAE